MKTQRLGKASLACEKEGQGQQVAGAILQKGLRTAPLVEELRRIAQAHGVTVSQVG